MIDIIKYKYNLYPENVINDNNEYYFYLLGKKYKIIELKRDLKELEIIVEASITLLKNNILIDKILINKDKKYYFENGDKYYCVLETQKKNEEIIDLTDILAFNNLLKTNKKTIINRDNWKELWSEKIDYFEYQISEMGIKYNLILNSFSYYVGMAENAIIYLNYLQDTKYKEYYLNHKRIFFPVVSTDILNPLNFIFDFKERDISEYLKTMFFNNENPLEELEKIIINNNFDKNSAILIYSRLLFPSYYFDLYEEILNKNKDEKEILKIINKVEEYEDFLCDAHSILNRKFNIPRIKWLSSR